MIVCSFLLMISIPVLGFWQFSDTSGKHPDMTKLNNQDNYEARIGGNCFRFF